MLVIPSLMAILPCVAVAEKPPMEARLSGPAITIAFAFGLEAVIVILPDPDVEMVEVELVENDPGVD